MSRIKKALLFIVEGSTDRDSLSPVLANIFENSYIHFHVFRGDITLQHGTTPQNIVKKVNDCVKEEMKRNGYRRSDIIKVYHLIDTDGAFIPDENVRAFNEPDHLSKISTVYQENCILCRDPEVIRHRNGNKTRVVRRLIGQKTIGKTPYELLFMSRNLEHVLHNRIETLTQRQKVELADDFADKYITKPKEFIEYISSGDIAVPGTFTDTWTYILNDIHSLQRNSNLHLIFSDEDLQEV